MNEIKGLSTQEVKSKQKLGLENKEITSLSPSNLSIILKNLFTIMHIILIPLIAVMIYFDLPRESIVFLIFIGMNTVINSFEEIRIKNRLEKLKDQFIQKVAVLRNGKIVEIPVSQIVSGEYIKANEGDPIVVDGKVIYSNYLQIDESALTGESNYINKEVEEKVLSGSFIVAGECIYIAEKVGDQNYLNKLGTESLSYKKQRSKLESAGDAFTIFFIITGIIISLINYYASGLGNVDIQDRILSVTTLVAMTIPQTLLLLYSLTFVISVSRLGKKGIIIQKRGAIDELAGIDVMCIDKTGTITTNQMQVIKTKFFNFKEDKLGDFFNSVKDKAYGKNNTFEAILNYFSSNKTFIISNFNQIPFNPKNKFSVFEAKIQDENLSVILGASSILNSFIDDEFKEEVNEYVKENEERGCRVLLALMSEDRLINENSELITKNKFKQIGIIVIEEELNPGIKNVLKQVEEQEIEIKVISGDSAIAVTRILERLDLKNKKVFDFSKVSEEDKLDNLKNAIKENYSIFTRAKPEDKLLIVKLLKEYGKKVAMVGDGINDVLGMKVAQVGIAMESGAKITRDISDIVLLENDYSKIPEVFYEGDNIVFNLKITTKIFLARSFAAFVLAIYFSLKKEALPIFPTSTLIFSFIGNTIPSYVLAFTRQKVSNQLNFTKDIVTSATPAGLFMGGLFIVLYFLRLGNFNKVEINTYMVLGILALAILYSLVLIFKAKKITNFITLTLIFLLSNIVGFFFTILPPWRLKNNKEKIIISVCVLVFALIIHFLLRNFNKKVQDKQLKKASYILPFIIIILAYLLPFQDYYAVEPIKILSLSRILIVTFLGIFGFGFIEWTKSRIFKN